MAGAGAAGGLGAALLGFCEAGLTRGVDLVARLVGLDEAIAGSAVVITGEGRIDASTARGKTAWGVAQYARRHGVPVVALAGQLAADVDALRAAGIAASFAICPGPLSLEQALADAAENLERTAANVAALWTAARYEQECMS